MVNCWGRHLEIIYQKIQIVLCTGKRLPSTLRAHLHRSPSLVRCLEPFPLCSTTAQLPCRPMSHRTHHHLCPGSGTMCRSKSIQLQARRMSERDAFDASDCTIVSHCTYLVPESHCCGAKHGPITIESLLIGILDQSCISEIQDEDRG